MAVKETIDGHIGRENYHYSVHEGSLAYERWIMTKEFVAAQLANSILGLQDKDVIINRALDFSAAMFELRTKKIENA